MLKGILVRIRSAVYDKRYIFTDHALEEADADNLSLDDVLTVLLTGDLESEDTDDPRGIRYIVRGVIDDIEIDVICRWRDDGTLLIIITVYVVGCDMMSVRKYPCEFCDTQLQQEPKYVTITRTRGGKWYIFEHVAARVCPNCGHRYFDADVLEMMESGMKEHPENARVVEAWAIALPDRAGR